MDYVLDVHSHTIISGHAYSTMREMARAAHERGLLLLGITEHGPGVPGSMVNDYYIRNTRMVDRRMEGLELMLGAEADIMNSSGELDITDRNLEFCDVVVASIHKACYEPFRERKPGKEEITETYIKVLENPLVDIIGHPDDETFPVDFDVLACKAAECGKLLEVNNNSLDPRTSRVNGPANIRRMLEACRKYRTPVVCNSDSHTDQLVGCHERSYELFREMNFPEELVMNTSVEKLKKHLRKYR